MGLSPTWATVYTVALLGAFAKPYLATHGGLPVPWSLLVLRSYPAH